MFKHEPTPEQEFFQEPFSLGKQNVDLLKTKLFMARIIFVQLPGWKKMNLKQSTKIAAVSYFELLRNVNFRLFARDMAVSQNAASFLARNGSQTKDGIKTTPQGSYKFFAFCQSLCKPYQLS